jgi:2,4-dienoyl-CoA reductase (NADPH2)
MARPGKLFEPIKIGNLLLKNRLVMLAMGLGYTTRDGKPGLHLKNFLVERAKGGVGLIITSLFHFPVPENRQHVPDVSKDDSIPALRELTETIHSFGVPIAGQLISLLEWRKDAESPLEVVGPSEVVVRPKVPRPRALTTNEIQTMIEQYGEAARRLREAGFDAVEIMAGIGGIVSRFMSPLTNKREDEYGGSFEKRMRLPIDIIHAVKRTAGEDFNLFWRYSAHEFVEGGYDLEGGKKIGCVLEKAGVHCLDLQVGCHDTPIPLTTRQIPEGHWAYLSREIKKVTSIPVITGYRISDPCIAERILVEGKADLIGMARALIADPELPKKAKEGKHDDIRRCICCCRCIDQCVSEEKPLDICSVNPRVGSDLENTIEPVLTPREIFIVGGGPAGMTAAQIAAIRGHRVTLYEKSRRLGGKMVLGEVLNTEIPKFHNYLRRQIRKLPIKVITGKEVTPTLLKGLNPNSVVLAVGGSLPALKVQITTEENVITFEKISRLMNGYPPKWKAVVTSPLWFLAYFLLRYFYNPSIIRWLLRFKFPFGKRVAIIGGGFAGCELAEVLVDNGKEVTIIEESKHIGADIGPSYRFHMIRKFRESEVQLITEANVIEITKNGLSVSRKGSSEVFDFDTVVLAVPIKPDNELAKKLEKNSWPVYLVGDCVEPHLIAEAVKSGYRVARQL